jgi:hypothetical protein
MIINYFSSIFLRSASMSASMSRSVARQSNALTTSADLDLDDDEEMTLWQPIDGLTALGVNVRDVEALKTENIVRLRSLLFHLLHSSPAYPFPICSSARHSTPSARCCTRTRRSC